MKRASQRKEHENIPTVLCRTVGTTRRERTAEHVLESYTSVLLQTAIRAAFVAKTVSSLIENDDSLDVRELFEGGIDLGQDACISTDAWRLGGTAEAQRGRTWGGS